MLCTPKNPMVVLIIIPTKWLFHWGYTPFSDIPMCQLFILKPGSLHHRTPHLSLQVLLPQQHAAICEDPWHQAIQRFQHISKPVNSEANLGSLIVGPQGYKNTDGSALGYKEPPFWLICESASTTPSGWEI